MEERSFEDDDSNVKDEIEKYNKIFLTFFVKFGVTTPSELKAYASA